MKRDKWPRVDDNLRKVRTLRVRRRLTAGEGNLWKVL